MTRYPLVLARWVDSATFGHWRALEEYQRETSVAVIATVGWLIKRNHREIVLLQSIADDGMGSDTMVIPTSALRGRLVHLYKRGKDGRAIAMRR